MTTRILKWRHAVTLLVVATLLLTGCVSRQHNSAPKAAPSTVPLSDLADLTLQVGVQRGGTEALLRAAGTLDHLPYHIAFSTFTSGPPQVEAATAGKIDVAITGNTPPIFGAAGNARIKVVSAYNGTGAGDQILVHADSPVTSVAELRGKTVAVGKGSSAHGNLLSQLKNAGLEPTDVQLVFLQPADAQLAFAQRRVDAWTIWDPYTALTQQQIPVRNIADPKAIPNSYRFGVASDAALSDPRRNTALGDLLVRYAEATKWAQQHPQEWSQKYAQGVGLDPQVAAVAEGRSLRVPTELDDQVIASEQRIANLFAASGQLQSPPNLADWVDRRFNDSLRPYLLAPN